jgi:type I restriction enzyme S subunit
MNKLPAGWEIKKLKDICTIQDGIHKTPKYTSKGIKFVSVENINDLYNSNKFISEEDYNKMYKIKAKKNDIFMTRIGDIGTPAILNKDEKLAYYVTLCLFTNIDEEVFNKYLYYAIQSNYFKKELYHRTLHVAFPKKINLGDIGDCKFILPPLDEQKRIASALSKIDAYLENTIKLIEEKERFKRGIAKKLLTCKEGENIPEARFKGFEDEWKEYNLSKIGVSYNGLRNKKANSFVENCNAKYITYKSVYDKNKIDINRLGNVSIGKNENQNLVKYGDIFFTISSETPDEVAISSVLLDEVENTYLNSFCFGFRFDFNILLPEFARYYFRSDYIRKSTYRLAQGITRYNISKKKFLDIIIYLPSLEEQEKIGGYLSLLDAEIDNLKKQKELIKEMKRGAMQKLLSGEVRLLE